MRRARILPLLVCLPLFTATSAAALPMWVTFSLFDPWSGTQAGSGGFTFDSDRFVPDPSAPSGYSGLLPALELGDAGFDFTAGPLAGTHFDLTEDIRLWWWDELHAPPQGLNLPMWSWGWSTTVNGCLLEGMDGHTQFDFEGGWYTVSWWGGTVPEDQTALPEPPTLPLLALGAVSAWIGARGRSKCRRGESNPHPLARTGF